MEAIRKSALAYAAIQFRTDGRSMSGITARRRRHEPPGVDRVKRHIRPDGRVDRRAELRLVINASLFHARGEINQRLLLRIRTQLACRILKSRQLSIRVEDVELGLISDKEAALILGIGTCVAERCELARIADVKLLNC